MVLEKAIEWIANAILSFEGMDWCEAYGYKFIGLFMEKEGESMMLFDLSETKVQIREEAPKQKRNT